MPFQDDSPAATPAAVEQRIGEAYVEQDRFRGEDTEETAQAYEQIAAVHDRLYEQIPIPVIWTYDDPYSDAAELRSAIDTDEELLVYAGGSQPEYMTLEENVKGRAVHDYFGHYRFGTDFSVEGEYRNWQGLKAFYPVETRLVLFADIVGQRCAAGYLENEFASPRFAQRCFPAPEHWIDLCSDVFD